MAAAYSTSSKLLFTMLIAITVSTMDSNNICTTGVLARPLSDVQTASSIAARLQSNGSYSECILFFINGERHLGRNCCRAIHIIQHKCWPAMLGSLGFTKEEGDILRGYCDSTAHGVPPTSPPSIVPLVEDDLKP
ncbi:hypothetical protein MKX01_041013 [Papaver californicum]|nr:hypothetical protein MKX01_041013 [Papaver californicum]